MGGPIPLSYKSHNKKLVIHDQEAKMVRTIFETYLHCPSVDELKHAINALGFKPKANPTKPFTKSALKNICVWNKTNGGMGSLYRSKHEMVAVYKVGTKPHINNIELGKHGRNRTNEWDYAGISSISNNRNEELAVQPHCQTTRARERRDPRLLETPEPHP